MSDEKKLKTATERTICLDPDSGVERVVAEGDKIPAGWTTVGSGELAGRADRTVGVGDEVEAGPPAKATAAEVKKAAALEKSNAELEKANAELQAKLDEATKAAEAADAAKAGPTS